MATFEMLAELRQALREVAAAEATGMVLGAREGINALVEKRHPVWSD